MIPKSRAHTRAFVLLAFVVAAVAALAATTGRATASAQHVMTPTVATGLAPVNLGQVDSPLLQVGRLRQCQLNGTCQGPDQLRAAYGFQTLIDHGVTGAGRSITIIDAYGSDTLTSDMSLYDSYFGLGPVTVNVFFPDGQPDFAGTTLDNSFGWKAETTLDVATAHVVAPGATINLVVAKSNEDSDILSAQKYVADHNLGDVVSQSFGEAEQCTGAEILNATHAVFDRMIAQGQTVFASSGDQGAGLPVCKGKGYMKATSSPATDPDVTAVGGTDLVTTKPTAKDANGNPTTTSTGGNPAFVVDPGGQYISESVWNDGPGSAGGGGVSSFFSRPDYQAPIVKDSHMREVPDIAYSGSAAHSVLVALSCTTAQAAECGGAGTFFFGFAGTSCGSPQWAAFGALADQLAGGRLGAINKTLYLLGNRNQGAYFHDVTTGNNSVAAVASIPGTPITGYSALPGWDEATGWGSPIAPALAAALAKPGQG